MEIEILTVCDAATDSGGKLNILGAFDSIMVQTFPAVHPQCAVALRVRCERSEEGEHKLAVGIMDDDGNKVVPDFDARMNIKFRGKEISVAANMIMNLQRLQFKKGGEHSINVAIDGVHEKSIPLVVGVGPAQQNQQPQS